MHSFTGYVANDVQAKTLFLIARSGHVRLASRLNVQDQRMIAPGQGYIYHLGRSRVKRWTDGRRWVDDVHPGGLVRVYREAGPNEGPEGVRRATHTITTLPAFNQLKKKYIWETLAATEDQLRIVSYYEEDRTSDYGVLRVFSDSGSSLFISHEGKVFTDVHMGLRPPMSPDSLHSITMSAGLQRKQQELQEQHHLPPFSSQHVVHQSQYLTPNSSAKDMMQTDAYGSTYSMGAMGYPHAGMYVSTANGAGAPPHASMPAMASSAAAASHHDRMPFASLPSISYTPASFAPSTSTAPTKKAPQNLQSQGQSGLTLLSAAAAAHSITPPHSPNASAHAMQTSQAQAQQPQAVASQFSYAEWAAFQQQQQQFLLMQQQQQHAEQSFYMPRPTHSFSPQVYHPGSQQTAHSPAAASARQSHSYEQAKPASGVTYSTFHDMSPAHQPAATSPSHTFSSASSSAAPSIKSTSKSSHSSAASSAPVQWSFVM